MSPSLLGPPELQSTTTVDSHPKIKSQPSITPESQTTVTSYISTGNPCLDFFHVAPGTPQEELIQRLQLSYQNNPLKTLKLICNLRGVKGCGKNDKEGFYHSALWLHKNHPKTLANNVGRVASFGSLKDLLEILFRVLEGFDVRKRMKDAWEIEKPNFFAKKWALTKSRLSELDNQKRKAAKAEKKVCKAKKAIDRYSHDPEYKYLFDCICDVFADLLRKDLELLRGDMGEFRGKLSLAAKWCPSLDSSYDESLLICESIAKKVFPREEYLEYEGIEEAHYAYRVRTRLRKEVLVPLRKELELPEVYMCAKRWRDIPYESVHSLAMHLGKKVFLKRDCNGFEEYLEEVRDGESTISAGALLPHEIICGVSQGSLKLDQVLQLQWTRMVDDLGKQGSLINCIGVCDNVMNDVSVALLLLVSELTVDPWKGKVVSKDEGVVEINGEKLDSKVDFVRGMYSYGSIDLHEVFDRVLDFAVEKKLGDEQMIRRLFVFTETEIVGQFWGKREYAEMQRKFLEKGYEKVPEIVFWNVKNSVGGFNVRCDEPGVGVVSGFSKNLMGLFVHELAEFTPEAVMDAAISSPDYDLLEIYD
ncbi:hypothetical protein RND81_14G133700 [Saponaria officinalis]|uniref:Uncharacterized protein n=1 Tax=Saponaria officinalis TaxID=3572 RepID=A0AAW1GQ40_SAPOF